MKMTLINLPANHLRQPDAQVPLGLLYLAAVLENNKIDVEIKNYSSFTETEAIADLPESGYYGITCVSFQLLQANRFAKLIKGKYPDCKVILGGPGTITDEFVDWKHVDSIVQGEGEITLLKVLSDFDQGIEQKIYAGELFGNLEKLPNPARHLVDYKGGNIFAFNKNYKGSESSQIITSRGCPYSCAYCAAADNKVRFRNVESVVDEIKQCVTDFGIKQFRIADDHFFANKKRVIKFAELVGDLDIVFRISTRVKPLDFELLQLLQQAGLKEISLGIESFDDRVLRGLNKGTTAKDNVKALEICEKVGLVTRLLMMIGTPFQTNRTVKINIDYLLNVPFYIVCCTHFIPIPGSDCWYNPNKYEIEITDKNLDNYNFYAFDKDGRREFKEVFRLIGRDMNSVRAENEYFMDFLESLGKLNMG